MKIRGYDKKNDEIKLQMTPMIDIVFQLLVFFIMTYKVTAMEGDYNIRMPSLGSKPEMQVDLLDKILIVTLTADKETRFLKEITVEYGPEKKIYPRSVMPDPTADDMDDKNNRSRDVFRSLNNFVIGVVGSGSQDAASNSEIEAEINADFDLRYEDTVYAIEAVSGYKDDDGQIVKLIEKVKFRDNSQ